MDLGPEVNGRLTTLLWKVEKLLENQERVLKNQDKLLQLMEHQQGTLSTRGSVTEEQSAVNGIRTLNHDHSRPEKHSKNTGDFRVSASLLEAVAHVKNKSLGDISFAPAPSSTTVGGKVYKAASKILSDSSNVSETTNCNGAHDPSVSVSVEENATPQNPVVIVSPGLMALNAGSVNCDSSSSNAEEQEEHSAESDQVKELLSWAERIQKTSCSVGNFTVNLVKVLFTKEEMLNKNCSGTRGKEALDSGKLDLVKFCAFKLYSIPPTEQDLVWKHKCVVSIDEFLRRGNRARVQNKTKDAPIDLSIADCVSDDIKVDKDSVDETCDK